MDKLDNSITNAQEQHEPENQFVNNTMSKIDEQQPQQPHKRGLKLWLPLSAGALAVVLVVSVLALQGGSKMPTAGKTSSNNSTSNTTPLSSQNIASGSDNASLASDLQSVQNSINQEGSDQNSANQSINDQSQVIAVPTD